jgi:hypothetical protein
LTVYCVLDSQTGLLSGHHSNTRKYMNQPPLKVENAKKTCPKKVSLVLFVKKERLGE